MKFERYSIEEFVPPTATAITLQYEVGKSDAVFISALALGPGMALEPPSGTVGIKLVEPSSIYVAVQADTPFKLSVVGWEDGLI